MKQTMLKMTALMFLLVLCMTLTGCYMDRDPWPASADFQMAEDAAAIATHTPPPALPTAVQVVATTFQPAPATVEPAVREEVDFWADEPTRVPGGSAEPGTNG